MVKPTVKVTRSGTPGQTTKGLADAIQRLRRSEVYVGIPADATLRKDDQINNASLMYIHTHGSPLNNIPARPVVEPGIMAAKDLIVPELGRAARALISSVDWGTGKGNAAPDADAAEKHLNRAGMIAANAVKRYFTEGDLEPNAPSTIREKGSDRPLIDTGELRRSVTYIVKEDKPD